MNNYKNIINIINFLRGMKSQTDNIDLLAPIIQNIKLLKELNLKSTFLVQYDVMDSKEMVDALKNAGELFEIGGWLEIVEPLATSAGVEWRGRQHWDYHANVDFPIGYTPDVRRKIVDRYMERFYKVFGKYPKSMGAWLIDSITLDYLKEKYDIEAACICRDQYGTDGYNFWGGYYSHGYYPSKKNMLCPAQTKEQQIGLPVFRMLGSDPIHQYDSGLINEDGKIKPSAWQKVITMEPAYPLYGGNPEWVDWFLKNNYSGNNLGFAYTQIGQENSFGWPRVEKGLRAQYAAVKKMSDSGKVSVEKLSESGKWFKSEFDFSPVCSLPFGDDWSDEKAQSFWYYSRFYRTDIYAEDGKLWVRDLQIFDENYAERYFNDVEKTNCSLYDTLPVMDGYRFSREDFRAGGYLTSNGNEILVNRISAVENREKSEQKLLISSDRGEFSVLCKERELCISAEETEFLLIFSGMADFLKPKIINEKTLELIYNGYNYLLRIKDGNLSENAGEPCVKSESGKISFLFG